MTLLELKYIMTSARNAAVIAKGMVELRSIVFYSREERERWRQGPRCLRCSKLRRIGGLGGLMMTPRRSSGCGACIPELTTRRHRGRSQAPWTIVMLVRKPSQSIHTSRETYTFRRRSRMPCVFSWPPLLVGDYSRVNRRVIFPLWGLSSCKPQDPKTSLYYPGSSSLLANPRVPHKPMLA